MFVIKINICINIGEKENKKLIYESWGNIY